MKKMIFMAVAACAMMFVSCGQKKGSDAQKTSSDTQTMSSEAQKAWQTVKDKSVNLLTVEGADNFETLEDYNAAVQEFNAAVQEMVKYQDEYSQEIADSFLTMSNQFAETAQKVTDKLQQLNDLQDANEALEELDEEIDEE